MKISIVIPTYNRTSQLRAVLDAMLASDVTGFDDVELIVVDDGSPEPANTIVESIVFARPFTLKCIRQENAGPAEARNHGFREAKHEIVLFIDDDILVLPDLIKKHWDAHQDLPGSVVFGKSPFVNPDPQTSSYRYLSSLAGSGYAGYERVNVVASGNLSIEKAMFLPGEVYRSGLRTPAAEEFELEQRLNHLGIPIYVVHEAIGWHLQPSTISDKCKQEFKYGVGAAEVWLKMPEIAENEHISRIVLENGHVDWAGDPIRTKAKKIVKSLFAGKFVRHAVLKTTNLVELIHTSDAMLFPMYRFLCGINLFAGVRYGLATFETARRNEQ